MLFKTKIELDKHVGKILMRARTDSDKNKEALKIAKLYFEIKEFDTADFYLTNYLSEYTFDAFAWKLKAEISELHQKNWNKAIDYYVKSYKSSDESDNRLLLKICNCFINAEKFEPAKAKEWLDRAIEKFPKDKITINLTEKLFESIDTLDQRTFSEWQEFLIDAMNDNCTDQELNFKFIKINLTRRNFTKAFQHLIKIEYKSLFERDSKWYDLVLDLLKSYTEKHEEFSKNDQSTKLVFYLMTINLMISQICGLIEKDDLTVLKYAFLRLDQHLIKFDKENLQLNNSYIYKEIISQYLYILGLLFLKSETKEIDYNELSRETKLGLFFLVKSLSCSSPNMIIQESIQTAGNETNTRPVLNDFVKLMHKDSCWRYSAIANWFKSVKGNNFANNFSKLLDLIDFSKQNFKPNECLSNFFNFNAENCFLLCHENILRTNIFNIYDNDAFDYADKNCLENQSFNLNYLIWHGLVNTNFNSKCNNLLEIPPYFFFHLNKNWDNSETKFGVENLNICNIESISVMDLKIFYYSIYYQALSKLKSTNRLCVKPFWLESNLSTAYQSDWWLHSSQEVLKSKTIKNFMSSTIEDFGYCKKIDIKKKNEILKILELIRLKSPSVKISTGFKNDLKFKIDLEIVISVAKYLQFLNDSIDCLNEPDAEKDKILETYGHHFATLKFELSKSPKEKQFYIKNYLFKYWDFILKQLIKLKQIYTVEEDLDEPLNGASILDESTMNSTSQENGLNLFENYFTFHKSQEKEKLSSVNLFSQNRQDTKHFQLFSPISSCKHSNIKNYFDPIIQTALLNLILNYTVPDFPGDEMHNFQHLEEAINTFNFVEESLKNKWKNELEFYHLKVCKKLAETLVLQRDALISLKSKNNEAFFQQNMDAFLNKVGILIELTKNKINIGLKKQKNENMVQKSRIMESINASFESSFINDGVDNIADTSISDVIINIEDFFKYKAENTSEAAKKRAEFEEEQKLKAEHEKIERERIEKEEDQKRQEELQRQKLLEEKERQEKEDKERQDREEKEQLKKELKIHQEKIKKLEQDEMLRWNKQKEEIEKEKVRLRVEINEEVNKKVKELEAQHKKTIDQVDADLKSDKIIGLINSLHKQRCTYFEMNKEILKEQFSFIKNQTDKINNEIKQIESSVKKRQHNPNLAQQMIQQQNEMNESKKKDDKKKSLGSELKTPSRNLTKMNETSFLSVNEFPTPDNARLSQRSLLEKPIGDIKFPSNFNFIDQLKKSADVYNSSQQSIEDEDEGSGEYDSEEGYDDENDCYDDEYYEEEDESECSSNNENTKQETFLSCEDYDLNKSEVSKSSINELQVLFNQNGFLYTYDTEKILWMAKGKCKVEVIGDEMVEKGNYRTNIICNLLYEKTTCKFDVTLVTNLKDFKNTKNAIYWFDTKKALINSSDPAGIRFENETVKNEFRTIIENCQKKMQNNKSKLEFRSSNSFLCPLDILPEDHVCKFEKQITFILNENIHQCVVLSITPIDNVFILTIKQNDLTNFKHIVTSSLTFQINEKPKLRQHIFKYKISKEQIRIDHLTKNEPNDMTEYDISLVFSSSPALNEFINILNLKK